MKWKIHTIQCKLSHTFVSDKKDYGSRFVVLYAKMLTFLKESKGMWMLIWMSHFSLLLWQPRLPVQPSIRCCKLCFVSILRHFLVNFDSRLFRLPDVEFGFMMGVTGQQWILTPTRQPITPFLCPRLHICPIVWSVFAILTIVHYLRHFIRLKTKM
jgi:hypothetical protein